MLFGITNETIPSFASRNGESVPRIPKTGGRGQPPKATHCYVGDEYDLSLAMRDGDPCALSSEGLLLDIPDNCYPSDTTDTHGAIRPLPDSVFANRLLAYIYRSHCARQASIDAGEVADNLDSEILAYVNGSKVMPSTGRQVSDEVKIKRVLDKIEDPTKQREVLLAMLAEVDGELTK